MSTSTINTSAFLLLVFISFLLLNLSTTSSAQSVDFSILYTNEELSTSDFLQFANYRLTMQPDCNLVLTNGGVQTWASNTAGKGKWCYLKLQPDGDLVIFDNQDKPVWSSCTKGRGGGKYILILRSDGSVVLYGGGPLWASDTGAASMHVRGGSAHGSSMGGGVSIINPLPITN